MLSEERDIIEWSFETARKYFPDEVLVINEGNPIQKLAQEDYRTPYFMMVENALLNGTEIDKIGLQNHFFAGAGCQTDEEYKASLTSRTDWLAMNDPMKYFKGLDVMAELGLPLELTEVTVPTFGDGEEAEELQADMLRLWYSVWFSHPAVDSVVYWNTVDGYAYVVEGENRYWNENNCRGGLWHKDLTPKKSAEMLKRLFDEEWHTDLELTTDANGYVDFRGFFGEYDGEIDGMDFDFEIHKNDNNRWEIIA